MSDKFCRIDSILLWSIKDIAPLAHTIAPFLRYLLASQDHFYSLPQRWSRKSANTQEMKLNCIVDQADKAREQCHLRIQFIDLAEEGGSKAYPMGVLYLSAFLKCAGFTNIQYQNYSCYLRAVAKPSPDPFDNPLYFESVHQEEERTFLSTLFERNPHVIMIGPVVTQTIVELIPLAKKLRSMFPQAIICAGGPHFGKNNLMDQEILGQCLELAGVVIGEGEETIVEIVEKYYQVWQEKKEIPSLTALRPVWASIKGLLMPNLQFVPRQAPDLADFPLPDYDLLVSTDADDPRHYFPHRYSLCDRRNPYLGDSLGSIEDPGGDGVEPGYATTQDPVYYFDSQLVHAIGEPFGFGIIVGSRNCPYHCIFCSSRGPRRTHSAQYLFTQVRTLQRYFDIRLFVFFDPLFTSAAKTELQRIDEFCELILGAGLNIQFLIEIRVDVVLQIPDALLVKMIRAGCVEFNMGFEKGSDARLKSFMKGITTVDHVAAIAKIRSASVIAECDVLIKGTFVLGGPDETRDDLLATIFHGFSLDLDGIIFFPLEIHPGTPIYDQALARSIISEGITPYLKVAAYPIYATPDLPLDLFNRINEILKHTVEVNNRLMRPILRARSSNNADFLVNTRVAIRGFVNKCIRALQQSPEKNIIVPGHKDYPSWAGMQDREIYQFTQVDFQLIPPLQAELDVEFDILEKELAHSPELSTSGEVYSIKASLLALIKSIAELIPIL